LPANSPCVDVGNDVSAVVGRDILGAPRPQGLAFDLGAYEFVSEVMLLQRLYLPLVAR